MKQVESPRRASQRQVFPRVGLARWSGSCSSHKPTRNNETEPLPSECILAKTQKLLNLKAEKVLPAWLQLGIVYLSVLEGFSVSHTHSEVNRGQNVLFYKAGTLKPDSAHLSNRQNARTCLILSEVLGSLAGSIWEHLNTSTGGILLFTIIFILALYTCHHPGHVYCFSGTVVVMCLAPAPSSFLLEVLPFSIFRPATFSSHHVLLVQAELDALMQAPPCTFT